MPSQTPKDTPLLSAEWINSVMDEVFDAAIDIYDTIFRDLLYSGYLPMERPASGDFVKRLSPEQRAFFGIEEPPEEAPPYIQQQIMGGEPLPPSPTSGPLALE